MGKKNKNFKETIRCLFLQYTLIPIILVFALFFIFMIVILKINVINNSKEACNNINKSLEEVYKNYYEEIERMSKSDSVINFMNTRLDSNLVYDEFYKFNNNQKVKSAFYIVDDNKTIIISTRESNADVDRFINKSIISKIIEKPNEILSQRNVMNHPYNKTTVYTVGKAIKDDSSRIKGYLVYQLYEEDLEELINVQNNQVSVVADNYDNIIVTNNNLVKGPMNKFRPQYCYKDKYIEFQKGKYYVCKSQLSIAPIYVYTLNSANVKSIIYELYFLFVAIVSIILWFLMNHLAEDMSCRNTKSIDKLIYSVNELQKGKMDSYVDIKSGDEFEVLGNQYNIMLVELNNLIKKNEELSNLRRIIEIKQLQSQFNPHFIFNVLETLRYSILIAPRDAEKATLALSKLLRYSVNYEGKKVILKKDLDYIEDYLKLNKFRFKERLKYRIDISEEIKQAQVPKLLLQAIIENSIKYGYKEKDTLYIEVRGFIVDENLILEVFDDGMGMNEEQLQNVRNILNSSQNLSKHIGLYNVNRRLVLLYGESYGIEINSEFGKGTKVKLTIPYEKGDADV